MPYMVYISSQLRLNRGAKVERNENVRQIAPYNFVKREIGLFQ